MIYVDIDGVLVDSFPRAFEATRGALRDILSFELRKESFTSWFWGTEWEEGIRKLNQSLFCEDMPHIGEVLAAKIKEHKDSFLTEKPWVIDPIAEAFVCSLDRPITLCTAGSEMGARSKIRGHFESLPLIFSARKRVPHFWLHMEDATLVIDDDDQVIAAAEAAGIPTIHWRAP